MREPTGFEIHNGRLFSTIESNIRYALLGCDAFDGMGNHLGRDRWKEATLDELAQTIGVHVRASLPNLLGEIIIAETIAFAERNWR
jgi:hypothetical protein